MFAAVIKVGVDGNLYLDIMELPETCVIVLSKGVAKLTELPAYAETKSITHQGQVKCVKWDEGEEF
ncbi:XtrA/YqaO family protein [Lysinibacillus sp. FSL W8-0953]|uniref:XtrA/YqaO family protein n=1 Tax=Lysinibacillus sp. FSL W8-0953 TaxID=2954640 RepID=UPI0030F7F643